MQINITLEIFKKSIKSLIFTNVFFIIILTIDPQSPDIFYIHHKKQGLIYAYWKLLYNAYINITLEILKKTIKIIDVFTIFFLKQCLPLILEALLYFMWTIDTKGFFNFKATPKTSDSEV